MSVDDYQNKINKQTIELVDTVWKSVQKNRFNDVLKEFWIYEFSKQKDNIHLGVIIDNFINSHHFEPEKTLMYRDIDKGLKNLQKQNSKVCKEYENNIDLIKYIIKSKSHIGKLYWNQVIENINDYTSRFSDGKDFRMQSGNNIHVIQLDQIQSDLVKFEDLLLIKLAKNYLNYRKEKSS